MKTEIVYSPLVKSDLEDAFNWYKKINVKFGHGFLHEYRQKIEYISQSPQIIAVRYRNVRVCFLNRFPYGVHFEFIESTNLIRVFAVLHTLKIHKLG